MAEDPPDHTAVVIHVADDVVQSGETVQLTFLLHFGELVLVELRFSNNAPVVSRGVHREAWRQRSVRPDDQRVPAGAATPRLDLAAHKFLHLKQARLLVDDLVALLVFLDYPVDELIHLWIIRRRQERAVLIEMFKVRRIDQRRFDNMVINADVVIVSKLGECLHIVHVRPADADVEKCRVAILPHVLYQVLEIRANRRQSLGQTWLFVDAIDGQIHRSETGITKPIDHIRFHQPAIGRQVHEEVLFRRVIDDLVNELRSQQRLTTHQRQ